MYLFVFVLPFILWLGLAYAAHRMAKRNGSFLNARSYEGGMWFAAVFTGFAFVGIFIINLIAYSEQRAEYNALRNQVEQRKIYEIRLTNMTEQYKQILVKDYPEYEKAIFEKMSPEDANKLTQLLAVYPQLKSSVTMGAYADNIKELNDDVYHVDLDIRKTVQAIRWNFITPWCITSLMPSPPDDLASYVKQ